MPGTVPYQNLTYPPFGHGGGSIAISGTRQPDGDYSDMVLSGSNGPIAEWVYKLFAATNDCWKPMSPPEPL